MLKKVRPVESVQEWWEERSTTIFESRTGGVENYSWARSLGDKGTWWWNDKV